MIETGDKEDGIIHFGAIRLRVVGSGNLIPTFYSLDNITSQVLVALPMSVTTDKEPTRLANFISQKAFLKLGTTELNEYFKIDKVIVYIRPIFMEYPS